MALTIAPCTLAEANAFVSRHHRHHLPTPVAKFSIAAVCDGVVVGVVIVGIPKARMAMDGWTLEVTRLASNGSRNVCSLLYGAARKAAFALGYRRVITYTLESEHGSSLAASGWKFDAAVRGESWKRRSIASGNLSVDDRNPTSDKVRWSTGEKQAEAVPRVPMEDTQQEVLPLGVA